MAGQREFRIVDPHMHLWDLERNRYPWLTPPLPQSVAGDTSLIAHTYLLDDYIEEVRDWTVVGAVHIDAGAHPDDALKETRWLQAAADRTGFPLGIVAYADLAAPDADAVLAAHVQSPNVRGIRHILNWHADPAKTYTYHDQLGDTDWQAGFHLLKTHDLSFDLQIYPGQMTAAADLATRHPETPIILNHVGMAVDRDEAGLAEWRNGMIALAACPNVSVKLSGLSMMDWAWTVDSIRPFILTAIDLFGTDRAMFASNFPTDRINGTFAAYFGAYREIVSDFSAAEQHALFAANANRIYRLGLTDL